MSGIKKLAGEAIWYGVPTIFTRFLSYAIAFVGLKYSALANNNYNLIYVLIPFLNILFTYGLETSYFRYVTKRDKQVVYNTLSTSIVVSTIILTIVFYLCKDALASTFKIDKHPEYIVWMLGILFFDSLAVLPFCKMRHEGRPRRFAGIKLINIIVNTVVVMYYTWLCPRIAASNPQSIFLAGYNTSIQVGYLIIANLVASALTLVLVYKELRQVRYKFDAKLWREIMCYSLPLLVVGLGGMCNEMISRLLFERFSTLPQAAAKAANSVFAANFKLAVLVTIFIQIFKMAAEPFFFKKAADADAKRTYARVMKFFVIACCFIYLGVSMTTLFLQKLISYKHAEYAEGIVVVPILALGYVFLGIYYNLSVWYKLTNKNMYGAYITIVGVIITIVLNIVLVPLYGYVGSAWATFVCYGYMMVVSYLSGQKHYRIPYATKKLLAYIVIVLLFYGLQKLIYHVYPSTLLYALVAILSWLAFGWFIIQVERKELVKIPYLNKLIH